MNTSIAIIGLGYVGLPLAVEFGKIFDVTGFDINETRIDELENGNDRTLEVDFTNLKFADKLKFTCKLEDIAQCNYFIVTVPTPIDKNKRPDLTPLIKASETVGKVLKKDDIVIYESTVYPGATEDDCVPVLEKESGLKFNIDFYCGYSPERINPGDKNHTVRKIKKVVSGSTPEIAQKVNELYKTIIDAGIHIASSIKVAEASKVIENAQRDINIAFINELAVIFNKLDLDTKEVLEAAGTKWNFLPYTPGLVGGHCIGVDPYYLTHKAQEIGHNPEIILAGRRLNDNMGTYIAQRVIKLMIKKGIDVSKSDVLILGITFKENCPDIRNSKVIDVIKELTDFGCKVDIFDTWADKQEVKNEFNLNILEKPQKQYDCIVLTVSHNEFFTLDYAGLRKNNSVLFDVKSFLDKKNIDSRL